MIPADRWAGLGPATIIRGDARRLPLPDHSVDLVVTSPPYFALRSYTDAGTHYQGQIGSEPTPDEFITALLECTAEMVRVIKPSGSIFVNLGDKYATSNPVGSGGKGATSAIHGQGYHIRLNTQSDGRRPTCQVRDKSLIGVPWRYAIRCIDDLGLILRAEIIWSKPNGLPESVGDRVRRSHEQWFHFVVQPRYYSAVDEIREEQTTYTTAIGTVRYRRSDDTTAGQQPVRETKTFLHSDEVKGRLGNRGHYGDLVRSNAPLGKLPGSVREVPSAPLLVPAHLGVDHFAAFPVAWPAWIIRGWSPPGVCVDCGEGRRPIGDKQAEMVRAPYKGRTMRADQSEPEGNSRGFNNKALGVFANRVSITGYACGCTPYTDHPGTGESSGPSYADAIAAGHYQCDLGNNRPRVGPWREYHLDGWTPAPTRPGVILDPFGGTGTTAMAARALGRHGVSVDLSYDYSRLARWRCSDADQLAAARGLPRAQRQADPEAYTLLDMLDEGAG